MANPFQQKSLRRKMIYIGAILALFFVSLLHRQFVVEPTSYRLQLRAVAQGQAELSSSAIRLALLGSRGLATCVLWQMALEKQTHHQWNQLELLVKSITTLQPNFVSPWLFQSWNLAFNVAVECDRTRDKYFYITRGMQLLAEGERRHQGTALNTGQAGSSQPLFPGNPDMRYYMAVYYLRKIGLSDEQNAMRCLFDMSCIDPKKRQPERFWELDPDGNRVIKLKTFRDFCEQNPRLVRRLKQYLRCTDPAKVVDYLERNQAIPSRFNERDAGDVTATQTPLLSVEEQFPALPPPIYDVIPNRAERTFTENFDVFIAARAWYAYAQEPLPPPTQNTLEDRRNIDPLQYRLPKMSTFLFRSFPARGQEYAAENLQSEGWYDTEGWNISDWFSDETADVTVIVGQKAIFNSKDAWQKAFDMYGKYGHQNGLLMPDEKFKQLKKEAEAFYKSRLFREKDQQMQSPEEWVRAQGDEKLLKSFQAYNALASYFYERQTANFDAHYHQCRVERSAETVAARKRFFQAKDEMQNSASPPALVERLFKDALAQWFLILITEPEFRELDNIQMETYEKEQAYLSLIEERDEKKLRLVVPLVAQIGMGEPGHVTPLTNFLVIAAKDRPRLRRQRATLLPAASLLTLAAQDPNTQNYLRARALPLRRVSGYLESVYFYQLPVDEMEQNSYRGALKDYLLVVTQPPGIVPFALTPAQREWQLTMTTQASRQSINEVEWTPLISEGAIQSVGNFTRLARFRERHRRLEGNQ